MAFMENIFRGGNLITGVAIGIGIALVAPAVIPALRPIAKSIIKAGLIAYDLGRVVLAQLNEQTGDIVAEARAELAEVGEAAAELAEVAEVAAELAV